MQWNLNIRKENLKMKETTLFFIIIIIFIFYFYNTNSSTLLEFGEIYIILF